ncbi:MAG: hypothetical protein U0800_02070 [Isosphaeraceae bacterium]
MKRLIPLAGIGLAVLLFQVSQSRPVDPPGPPAPQGDAAVMDEVAASTYEHLSTVIIETRKTEDDLVKSILLGYHAAAQMHLKEAAADGKATHMEAAAAHVANIANEGDKRILAIRQRLAKAGHTHNTDADTKDDYMFINSKEKKELVALAQKIAKTAPTKGDAEAAAKELSAAFGKAIAAEK